MGLFKVPPRALTLPVEDLYLEDALSVAKRIRGCVLTHADPPWIYSNDKSTLEGIAAHQYATVTMADIIAVLNAAYDSAPDNAYLLMWCTFPKLLEWFQASDKGRTDRVPTLRWRYVSAGAWVKTGGMGVGYHWRGDAEPLLLYVKGHPKPAYKGGRNGHTGEGHPDWDIWAEGYTGQRGRHSAKPKDWLQCLLRTFVPEGGKVLDLYAGSGTLMQACRSSGVSYYGAEIDPERYLIAIEALEAQEVSCK